MPRKLPCNNYVAVVGRGPVLQLLLPNQPQNKFANVNTFKKGSVNGLYWVKQHVRSLAKQVNFLVFYSIIT